MAKRDEYLQELREIAAQNGGMVRPDDVVAFAKNPTTALHGCFTWDNNKAGEILRRQEARQILRVMVAVLPGEDPLKYRAYVSLKEDRYNGEGYRAVVDVMSDGRLREIMLIEAMAEMQVFMNKYENLKELAGIFAAMTEVVKTKSARKTQGTRQAKYRRPQPTA